MFFIALFIFIFIFLLCFLSFKLFNYYSKDLYLEKIKGEKALKWVKKQNSKNLERLSDSRFENLKNFILSAYESEDKLIYGSLEKDFVYHLLKNKKYKRGLLRRIPLKDYLSGKSHWEEVLDIDALAKKEKENWVYQYYLCHSESDRALIFLSRGGKDASVVREFDLVKKEFVHGGFALPESRTNVSWLSREEILLATDWKTKDSFTNSNYPRTLKILKRGQALKEASTLLKTEKTDMGVSSFFIPPSKPKEAYSILRKAKDFFSREYFLFQKNRQVIKVPLPLNANIHSDFQGDLLVKINKNWMWKDKEYPSGSLLIVNPDKLIKEESSAVQLLMKPTANRTPLYAQSSKNKIYIYILEDVKSSLVELSPHQKKWKEKLLPLPALSSLSIIDANPENSDVFFSSETFLESEKLYHYNDVSEKLTKIQELPSYFDSNLYKVDQFFAKSFDNTQIPYFVVSKKDVEWNGKNPVLISAYGGFQDSQLPFYSAVQEFAWYRKGGVFVLANIRGGGEYGPAWHQAGLKEKRQTVFNDFYAVAEDLIQKKITSPSFLGIKGGSNGGLLMGVAITQKPELFQAALIGIPLLDMLRYHKLLVGSSWIAEYGDPGKPEMKKFIRSYSPYQNLNPNTNYPEVFLHTSTLDDRVHPGHARRFARKLEKMGKAFYYYENFEGGHSGAADFEQRAFLETLQYLYLYKKLMNR